jgi:hypothetical protein
MVPLIPSHEQEIAVALMVNPVVLMATEAAEAAEA